MPISAGSMNQQVQFLRRTAGLFAPYGAAQWARLRFERAETINIVGVLFQGRSAQLTVRACDLTRGLKVGDRAVMDGDEFEITIRKAVENDSDDIGIEIQSAATNQLYEQEMDRRGEMVIIRRIVPNGPSIDAQVRAIVTGYLPEELNGGVMQGDSRVILLASDVAASAFPLPFKPRATDRVVFGGRVRSLEKVDDNTHRVAGVQLAYDCTVRG